MDCSDLSRIVNSWFTEALECSRSGERLRVTTPLRRPHGDLIEVWVREQVDGSLVVSDLGESMGFLVSMGYDPREGTNSGYMMRNIAHRYDVELRRTDGVLRKHLPAQADVGSAVWMVAEAAKELSQMVMLSRSSTPATISDEVASVLVSAEVHFEANARVIGDTGKRYRADFAFAGLLGMEQSQGLLKTLSAETGGGRQQAVNLVFRMWSEVKPRYGMLGTVVDDRYSEWPAEDIASLEKLSHVYYWAAPDDQRRFRDDVRRFAVGSALPGESNASGRS